MTRISRIMIALVLSAMLAACGGGETTTAPSDNGASSDAPKPTATTAAAPATNEPATAAPASGLDDILNNKGEKISLTIGGSGPHAGSYETTSAEGACSTGTGNSDGGGWGNQYSIDSTDPKEFSSLQLIADTEPGANETNKFLTTVTFGELFGASGTNYEIKALSEDNAEGNGTVTIDDRGDTATITIKGETADGTPIEATIECLSVIRFGAGDSGSDGPVTPANGIKLTISGGDLAGDYDLTPSSEISGCGAGADNYSVLVESLEEGQRANNFTFSYLDEESGAKLNWIELLIADASQGATGQFYLDINGQTFYIENLAGSDSSVGTVEVDDRGDSATITIKAKDQNGNTIDGTIECNSVQR
jgi:hypothetical protein